MKREIGMKYTVIDFECDTEGRIIRVKITDGTTNYVLGRQDFLIYLQKGAIINARANKYGIIVIDKYYDEKDSMSSLTQLIMQAQYEAQCQNLENKKKKKNKNKNNDDRGDR